MRSVHTSEVLGQGTSSVPTSGAGAAAAVAASTTSSASSVSVGVGCSASSLDWTFSVIHGDDFSSLDLIASSAEEATIWVTGLNALLGTHLCKYHTYFSFLCEDIHVLAIGRVTSQPPTKPLLVGFIIKRR